MAVDEINRMQTQLDSVLMPSQNIEQIQRGISECQHTFEILVDTVLHAQDGVFHPHLITITKIKDMMRRESLPDELDFTSAPSLEPSRLITPIIFSQYPHSVCSSRSLTTVYCILNNKKSYLYT